MFAFFMQFIEDELKGRFEALLGRAKREGIEAEMFPLLGTAESEARLSIRMAANYTELLEGGPDHPLSEINGEIMGGFAFLYALADKRFGDHEKISNIVSLLYLAENATLVAARDAIICTSIMDQGYGDFLVDLREDMKKNGARARVSDVIPREFGDLTNMMYANHDAYLNFGLDYFERWKMYNELFEGDSVSDSVAPSNSTLN
jgi:hypothetical protein